MFRLALCHLVDLAPTLLTHSLEHSEIAAVQDGLVISDMLYMHMCTYSSNSVLVHVSQLSKKLRLNTLCSTPWS